MLKSKGKVKQKKYFYNFIRKVKYNYYRCRNRMIDFKSIIEENVNVKKV